MQPQIERVEQALKDLRQGKMVILTDNPERENEGDLIIAGECITTEVMNFMIRNGTGIVCVSMPSEYSKKFDLPLMVAHPENTSAAGTPFTISIDAKNGITTGVSAADRTETIRVLVDDKASANDLVKPGHIFPLLARDGGVFERQGHTEGAIDLLKMIGKKPVAVICEIMNIDGSMTRGKQLQDFANQYQLNILSIDDIIAYRLYHEYLIEEEASSFIPLEKYGRFNISVLREKYTGEEHIVLRKENQVKDAPTLVRIHSSCFTGDLFASQRCDCHDQLHHSLERISKEGGILIYLNQEGRGIGLLNKIRAYALQEEGYDTVDANVALGLPVDSRKYHVAASVLRHMKINDIRLLTNNPDKIEDMKKYGIESVKRELMPTFEHEHNQFYLRTKRSKLNHFIHLIDLTG